MNDKIDVVALTLIKRYSFVTSRETDTIYFYNGKIYESKNSLSIIKEESEKLIPSCTITNRNEVIGKIKSKTYKDLESFDNNPFRYTLENGILDIKKMKLTPHTKNNLSKILIPCNFTIPKSNDLEKTLFYKYLKNSFTINNKIDYDNIQTVLEMCAAAFIRKNIDEKSFIMLGSGHNGKSVCLDYLSAMLGKENVAHIPLQVLSEDKFAAARLESKLANIFSDLEKNELKHTGIIKSLSSGEPIYVQNKNQQGFNLYPFATLIFSTNKFPKVFDQTQGFMRRFIILKWNRDFEKDPQRDSNLKEKLLSNKKEIDIVFSNLMYIAKEIYKNNKFSHSKDWKIIQKMWNESADPVNDFIENYIIDSETSKTKRETYQFYKNTMYSLGSTPLGMGQFSKAFSEYYEESKTHENRVWLNIDFKKPIQTKLI
jgi:P4 family phage/plasmid primase-like protien